MDRGTEAAVDVPVERSRGAPECQEEHVKEEGGEGEDGDEDFGRAVPAAEAGKEVEVEAGVC